MNVARHLARFVNASVTKQCARCKYDGQAKRQSNGLTGYSFRRGERSQVFEYLERSVECSNSNNQERIADAYLDVSNV